MLFFLLAVLGWATALSVLFMMYALRAVSALRARHHCAYYFAQKAYREVCAVVVEGCRMSS